MKAGRSLEKLIAHIERAWVNDKNVKVESPKRLIDKITKKLREHDVVISINREHHTLIIAIECRDRSRPVGVSQVEAFYKKCQDTGINQGIIVSPRGFCKTALIKATSIGLRCFSLEEANQFNWLQTASVNLITFPSVAVYCRIETGSSKLKRGDTNFQLVNSLGQNVSIDDVKNMAHIFLYEQPQDLNGPISRRRNFAIKPNDLFLKLPN